jgi:alkylmercury lyase
MSVSELEAISRRLADGQCCDGAGGALRTPLLRLLAKGWPVSREQLAAALQVSHAEVDRALRQFPDAEFDDHGDIIALGLSLLPTPHQFCLNGHELYTWCALDTLMYPAVLQQRAQVTSRCPVSGDVVRLTVRPDGIEQFDPTGALVSIAMPDVAAMRCDTRAAFCDQVHFFSGADSAAGWQAANREAMLLSVDDAHGLGRLLARKHYRTGSS